MQTYLLIWIFNLERFSALYNQFIYPANRIYYVIKPKICILMADKLCEYLEFEIR